ncbi:MAG: DoxX family membrane protein [Patescibacteria group bacterium]
MNKKIEWVLRIGVAGEFIGHGMFALQGKQQWIDWFSKFGISDAGLAAQLLLLVGLSDVFLGVLVLLKPVRIALLWMALWGFWTALLRPLVGMPVWDFVERWANWSAPLALLLLVGWPKSFKEWFRYKVNSE